jgi:hypothetical protein
MKGVYAYWQWQRTYVSVLSASNSLFAFIDWWHHYYWLIVPTILYCCISTLFFFISCALHSKVAYVLQRADSHFESVSSSATIHSRSLYVCCAHYKLQTYTKNHVYCQWIEVFWKYMTEFCYFCLNISGLFLTNFNLVERSQAITLCFLLNKLCVCSQFSFTACLRLQKEWAGRRSASNARYILVLSSSLRALSSSLFVGQRWQIFMH